MAKARPGTGPPPPPPPLTPTTSTAFEKDAKRLVKRGKDMIKLREVVDRLCSRETLDPKHRDHALAGEWKGWRDCHLEPDWLLICRTTEAELILGRMGTHSDLFER